MWCVIKPLTSVWEASSWLIDVFLSGKQVTVEKLHLFDLFGVGSVKEVGTYNFIYFVVVLNKEAFESTTLYFLPGKLPP